MSNLVLETFEEQLRDCLTHLYDYTFLQNHPLLRQLIPASTGEAHRVQNFRNLVINTIESLKPEPDTDSFSKQTRYYTILVLRHLKQQPVQYVVNELHLGERQFYRDYGKALHSLSQILWEHAKGIQPALAGSISFQSEIQRIHAQSRQEQIEVRTFLQKCLDAIQALTDRSGTRIQIQGSSQRIVLTSDSGILRQAIIWIASQLVVESLPGSDFTLAFENRGDEGEFAFSRNDLERAGQPLRFSWEKQGTLNNLIQALGGRIDEFNQHEDYYQVNLTIPMKQHFVLIIDDNPDAVAIFRSYLIGYPYQVLMACEGESALQLARDSSPDLIILDLLLPQQDGWEILRSLKTQPLTEHIPVLICSVLETAELAQGLGADGFLRKPPGEAEFLNVLTHLKPAGL